MKILSIEENVIRLSDARSKPLDDGRKAVDEQLPKNREAEQTIQEQNTARIILRETPDETTEDLILEELTGRENNIRGDAEFVPARRPMRLFLTAEEIGDGGTKVGREEQEEKPADHHIRKEETTEPKLIFSAIWNLIPAFLWTVLFAVRGIIRYFVHRPIHFLFDLSLVSLLILGIVTGTEINNQLILDKISDQTIKDILEVSAYHRRFRADEVDKSGAKEFLRVGGPDWMQRESVKAVLFHARRAGLPIEHQAVLLATVDIESGFNPLARAPTTSACGLFQFVRRTGEAFRLSYDDCMDPWENARAGVDHYMRNLERRVIGKTANLEGAERVLRTFELSYYAHHDGVEFVTSGNEVKALILSGSHFLFRVYHILLQESRTQEHAPGFSERFASNWWKFINKIRERWRDSYLYTLLFQHELNETPALDAL